MGCTHHFQFWKSLSSEPELQSLAQVSLRDAWIDAISFLPVKILYQSRDAQYVGDRTSGFLFHNRKGNFLSQTNLLRRGLHPALEELKQPKAGFHAFRRYRLTWLRKSRVHADLERFWMGHENETVGDGYSKMREDVAFRLEQAETVGLGFALPPKIADVVRIVRKNEAKPEVENAA
jgi:hypothetical protein